MAQRWRNDNAFTEEQKAALAEYRGPVTICPPMTALGDRFSIEDSTLAAGGPVEKPKRKPGRPKKPKRLPEGERFYHGEPCRNCGGTLRYTNSRACVACMRSKARERAKKQKQARKEAREAQGPKTFEGKPCRMCGSTTRYTVSRACVACTRERTRLHKQRKRKDEKL